MPCCQAAVPTKLFPLLWIAKEICNPKNDANPAEKPHLQNPSVYHIAPKKVKSSVMTTLGMRGGNAN